jgi:hypothetical protein
MWVSSPVFGKVILPSPVCELENVENSRRQKVKEIGKQGNDVNILQHCR